MRHQCPACQRTFAEPGFCPHDGKPLGPVADRPTVVSAYMPAAPDADTLEHKPTEPGFGPELRAVSASESPNEALELLRARARGYDHLIGQTLDRRYIVERKIGEGGMGVVFAVRHNVIERPLAIKVLKREVMRDSATISRFKREAQAASRIGHPNIVDVTDFGETPDGMTYSVMEYVEGETLAAAIKHGAPFSAERVARIASQIARALEAAHNKGIIHRDLKPENVFLADREGRPDFVKIVDFGIAKIQPVENAPTERRLTKAGAVFGTPEYMAPEQASGRGDTDRRADIYALGTIMYEMLVGKVPHKGTSMMQTIAMQLLDPVMPMSQVNPDVAIPPALEAIVMKALAKQRDDRFPTMAALGAELDRIGDPDAALQAVALQTLPPGADPSITPSPAAPIMSSDAAIPLSIADSPAPRRNTPPSRPLHEPEFVSAGSRSFEHVFDPAPAEPKRRRWPLIALAAVAVVGGGALVAKAVIFGHDDQPIAREITHDAPRAADAAVVVIPVDAAPTDAEVIAELRPDGGVRARPDAGIQVAAAPVLVTVFTRPGEANVFIDGHRRGPGGVHIPLPAGVKQKIECRIGNYEGSVVWDGVRETIMCTAVRKPMCRPELHNPFDHCKDDGTTGDSGPVVHPN